MNDFIRKVRQVAPYTEFDWSEEESMRNLQALHQRFRQRHQQRRGPLWRMVCVTATVLISLSAMAVFVHWYRSGVTALPSRLHSTDAFSKIAVHQSESPSASEIDSGRATTSGGHSNEVVSATASLKMNAAPLQFSDGSQATPLEPATRMVVGAVSEHQVNLSLGNGAARFDVTPNPDRRFEVDAGMIRVVVLGTSFTVVRKSTGVSVTVHRGVVRTEWPGGSREIRPAQGLVMFAQHNGKIRPVENLRHEKVVLPIPDEADKDERTPVSVSRANRHPDDRLSEGDASQSLQAAMRAADAERLLGNCERAVEYLQTALNRFPDSPGSATASFTLGRVLLEECHRPREAANAFYQTRQKQPDGVLAEDALAREVEAWHQARDTRRARMLALKYMKLYPNGVRKRSVRRFGSIE